jgi:hypothetical protein
METNVIKLFLFNAALNTALNAAAANNDTNNDTNNDNEGAGRTNVLRFFCCLLNS